MLKYFQTINQLFPSISSVERSQNKYLEAIGLSGLCLYAFAFPFSKDICYIGEWLMVGAFLFSLPRIWPIMKKDPVWIAFLVLFFYLIFKGLLLLPEYKEEPAALIDAIRWRLRFLWVFIIAWWIGGSKNSLLRILLISLSGFLVLLASGYDSKVLAAAEEGVRISFGINAQHFSLYAATSLCGCLFLAKDLWGNRYRNFRIFIWIILVFLLLNMTIVSQTRAIWIAIIIFFFFFVASLIVGIKNGTIKVKPTHLILYLFISILLTSSVIIFFADTIHKRISLELAALNEMVSSNFEKVDSSTSLGMRVNLAKWSISKIKQRPLIGWHIAKYSREAIGKEVKDKNISAFHHVHNSYLEISIDQGLIGLVIFLFSPLYVIGSVYFHYKKRKMPYRLFITFFSITILFGIANLFESYFTTWLFWPYFSILFGGFYSLVLWDRLPRMIQTNING